MLRPSYKPLRRVLLNHGFCQVPRTFNPPRVSLDSPAVDVMTDLSRVPAATISAGALLKDVHLAMIHRGVRLLLVTDDEQGLKGVVSAHDLQGERPLRAAMGSGRPQDELTAADIMTPADRVEAVALEEVLRADVAHVVETLKTTGRQHALVVAADGRGGLVVRGVFSLAQVARQLGVAFHTSEIARTFAEIESALVA